MVDDRQRYVSVVLGGLLFTLYPFHVTVEAGELLVNLSYGDLIVFLIGLLWITGAVGAYRLPKYAAYLGIFLVLAILSLIANYHQSAEYFQLSSGLLEVMKIFGAIAWMISIYVFYMEFGLKILKAALTVSVGVVTLVALFSLYESLFIVGGPLRSRGTFENPNIYGNYIFLHLFISLYLSSSISTERLTRLFLLVPTPILLIALVNTGSRGSILGLAAGAFSIVIFMVAKNRIRLKNFITVVAGATAAATVPVLYNPEIIQRMLSNRNIEIRLRLWRGSLEALLANPLFGIGYGQTPTYLLYAIGEHRGTHNTYLLVGGETGIMGLLVFILFLSIVYRDGIRMSQNRTSVVFLWGAFVGMLVQGLVTDIDNFRSLWILIGLLAVHQTRVFGPTKFDLKNQPGKFNFVVTDDDPPTKNKS